jgi:hypothetical protein
MNGDAAKVRKLLRQQTAIARVGSFALREGDLLKVLTEAARVCAEGLNVPYSKVCRYRTAENDLLIEAGHGWKAGVVGTIDFGAYVKSLCLNLAEIQGMPRQLVLAKKRPDA